MFTAYAEGEMSLRTLLKFIDKHPDMSYDKNSGTVDLGGGGGFKGWVGDFAKAILENGLGQPAIPTQQPGAEGYGDVGTGWNFGAAAKKPADPALQSALDQAKGKNGGDVMSGVSNNYALRNQINQMMDRDGGQAIKRDLVIMVLEKGLAGGPGSPMYDFLLNEVNK